MAWSKAKRGITSRRWEHLRQQVIERDNYACTYCGRQGRFEVHHVDHDRQNNHIDNLTLLCRSCHITEHSNPISPEQAEWNTYILSMI